MVLLNMTPTIVEAIRRRNEIATSVDRPVVNDEPTLEDPAAGKPISHGQVVDLWKDLRGQEHESPKYSLEYLLRGSTVYIPPPPPKPEPVSLSSFFSFAQLSQIVLD